MATWVLKTEPGEFSFDDLCRDGACVWDGVTNAAAQKHLRSVKTGDHALIYHTGEERRIAGLAEVTRGAFPDPAVPGVTAAGDPKGVLIEVRAVKPAGKSCTLTTLKADPRMEGFDLIRLPRLSVVPVPAGIERALRSLAGL